MENKADENVKLKMFNDNIPFLAPNIQSYNFTKKCVQSNLQYHYCLQGLGRYMVHLLRAGLGAWKRWKATFDCYRIKVGIGITIN